MSYARQRYGRSPVRGLVAGGPYHPQNLPRPFMGFGVDSESATAVFGEIDDSAVGLRIDDRELSLRDTLSGPNIKTLSGIALTYHGYKRTGSILWALIYGSLGKTVPLVAVPVSFAQGFGKRKEGC